MSNDNQVKKRAEQWEQSIPGSERNPQAKETFDDLISRAAKPVQPKLEKSAQSADYTDKQTHSRSSEDISGSHSDTSHQ